MNELSENLKFNIEAASNEKELDNLINDSPAYLIVSKKNQKNLDNQIVIDN